MAFGCKVYDNVEFFVLEKSVNKRAVGNISPDKLEMTVFHRPVKSFEIAGISQKVEADYIIIGMLAEHMIDKVAADKAGASRNENLHAFVLHIK